MFILSSGNAIIHCLGVLDWEIYSCISDEHTTDEVIITDEQLMHIHAKHPEAYHDVIHYVRSILNDPDYILKDKHPNTGLVIKRIYGKKESSLLVLRVSTSADREGYKNSVITSWKISEKRLNNYLRN